MLNNVFEVIKELFGLLILIEVVMFAFRFLLGGTIIGRMLLAGRRNSVGHFKGRVNVWKRRIRTTMSVICLIKTVGCNVYKKLDERFNNTEEEVSEEVVNGGKIIDLNTVRELKHKWDK